MAAPDIGTGPNGEEKQRDGEAYRDHIPGATLLATEGLGHRKILQQAEVLDEIFAALR